MVNSTPPKLAARAELYLFSVVAAFYALSASSVAAQRCGEIILATTTSTQDTGLLDSLLPMFTRETCIQVKPIAVGTGAALEMARRGDADAVLVHAPEAEKAYVESGDLIDGHLIMHNDFLVLGPANDPAKIQGEKDAALAMKDIAAAGSFVSRGDGSGTEKKELELWKAAGVSPASMLRREETGQGMGATLLVADARQTYTLTDRGTYLAFKDKLTLVPLVEGDLRLRNIYHAYVVNPGKHPTVKRSEAARFVRYLIEPKVQEWIGQFGRAKFGEPLFVPDALPSVRADRRTACQVVGSHCESLPRANKRGVRSTEAIPWRARVEPAGLLRGPRPLAMTPVAEPRPPDRPSTR